MGFHELTFTRSIERCLNPKATDLVVIEGHFISQSNMDEVLRGCLRFVIVVFPDHTHLLFLLSLFSCAKTNTSTRPRMTMPEHTSLESVTFLSS